MAKKFYTIIKSNTAATSFEHSFEQIKQTFPGLERAVTMAASSPASNGDSSPFHAIKEELDKIIGISKSSLAFHKNHMDDGLSQLTEDSAAILSRIQREAREELNLLGFLHEQSSRLNILAAIAEEAAPEKNNQKEP